MKRTLLIMMIAVLIFGMFGCAVPENGKIDVQGSIKQNENTNVPSNKQNGGTVSGELAGFTSKTLDGESFTSDYFAKYDVTVINVWATWCQPCVSELEHLEKLNNTYSDKNVSCIGILFDSGDDGAVFQAKSILASKGATYMQLEMSEKAHELLEQPYNMTSLPTTFFVNSNGDIIDVKVGADSYAGWCNALEGILG